MVPFCLNVRRQFGLVIDSNISALAHLPFSPALCSWRSSTTSCLRAPALIQLAETGVAIAVRVGLTRLLRTMLYGVGVTDALTFVAAPLGMIVVILMATYLPALRATRISPVVALRNE
jgi:hypothetical protein